jgi:Cdc6-like AAA superfamily ATPase
MLQTNELRVFISSTLIRSEYRRGRSLCRERGIRFTEPPTPLEQERSRHESFSLSRRRAYIANPVYLKKLNDHATSDAPPLIVYAESGSGKSSLFAFWAEQYRRKNPEAHVIEHYVGIGATSTDHYAVIRHVCMEINERFGRTEEIPSEPAKLDLALGQWLGYADHELKKRGESMVLILDGLNQL